VNLTECEIRSVLFGPHGRVEEWNLTSNLEATLELPLSDNNLQSRFNLDRSRSFNKAK
jgi:hypothetical protein